MNGSFVAIVNSLAPVFLVMALGWVLRSKQFLSATQHTAGGAAVGGDSGGGLKLKRLTSVHTDRHSGPSSAAVYCCQYP
jgi:hypothetical protein